MAGIAETCTHVAAMLFKLEAVVRCREMPTVTGQPAYWMIPSNMTKVGAEAGHRIFSQVLVTQHSTGEY